MNVPLIPLMLLVAEERKVGKDCSGVALKRSLFRESFRVAIARFCPFSQKSSGNDRPFLPVFVKVW